MIKNFKRGDKFHIKNVLLDIEILGFIPAGQTKDGVDLYPATINGLSIKISRPLLEELIKGEVNGESNNNRN